MRNVLATLLLIVSLVVSATPLDPGTHTVCSSGCDYTSIQVAVDAASDGDTIELGAETFFEYVCLARPPGAGIPLAETVAEPSPRRHTACHLAGSLLSQLRSKRRYSVDPCRVEVQLNCFGAGWQQFLFLCIFPIGSAPILPYRNGWWTAGAEWHWLKCVVRIGSGERSESEVQLPAGRERVERMGSRLYVGNLPFSADEESVRQLFAQDGREVTEVKMITDRDTGRPRGFGFVEMGSSADAETAISALNGYSMDGRALTVNEARERSGGGGGGGGGGRGRY